MRKTCLRMIHEFARRDPRVIFIGSDLGVGTLDGFRREFPERFFMEGVNEANLVGMAAGLAAEGHIVYVNTLAVFLTRRAYEQVALDVCLHNRNVRLIGYGGGLVYAPLGPTHTAIEDIALMRSLPNMGVLAPADANEMESLMRSVEGHEGPVYVRIGKGSEPLATPKDADIPLGQAVRYREGGDAVIITTGVTLHTAIEAADALSWEGVEAAILHFPTVAPLDRDRLVSAVESTPVVVAVEEHVRTGGLGAAVAECVAGISWRLNVRYRHISLPDLFPDRYGSQSDLMEFYGVTPKAVVSAVRQMLSGKGGV